MRLNCYHCGTFLDIDFDDYRYTDVNSFCPRCGTLIDNLLSPEQVAALKERLAMAEDDIKNGRYKTSEEVFKEMREKLDEESKKYVVKADKSFERKVYKVLRKIEENKKKKKGRPKKEVKK